MVSEQKKAIEPFLKTESFSRFTYRLWKENHFSASCVAPEKKNTGSYASYISLTPPFRIIDDQIMEVEARNLTACNFAQKLVCLEDFEGGKFDVVYASAEKCHR